MSNASEPKGRLTTFYHTLTDIADPRKPDVIVIPKIQRDYAQGRPSASKIRERFLNALFAAIDTEEAAPIELDFVYGELKDEKYPREFLPLDGQQRLTTLYLLHWYIAKRLADVNVSIDDSFLRKFSYENRSTSKEFCHKLIELQPPFSKLPSSLKDYILDRNWMTGTWNNDPTISSMIEMLNDIHNHYKSFSSDRIRIVWDNLIGKNDLGKIRFYRLYIGDMDTSDDLYIKMNSRGKSLTDFEHFKAEIDGYLPEGTEFSLKVDTHWTNLIWDYRDKNNDDNPKAYEYNGLDDKFLRLFKFYMVTTIIKQSLSEESYNTLITKDYLNLASIAFENKEDNLKDFEDIMDYFVGKSKSAGSIENFFGEFVTREECSKNKVYIGGDLIPDMGVDYLKACCLKFAIGNEFSVSNILILNSFFLLARKEAQQQPIPEFKDRLRILRNLIQNSPDSMRFKNLHDLLLRSEAIIENNDIDTGANDFVILQKKQEMMKLNWLCNNGNANAQTKQEALYAVENHHLLMGNIQPLLLEENVTDSDIKHFDKFRLLFSSDERLDRIERALLAVGDYGYENGGRFNYGGRNGWSWRNEVFVYRNKTTPKVLSNLLDKLTDCSDDELRAIYNGYLENCDNIQRFPWDYYKIKYPEARYGASGKYMYDGMEYHRIMLNKTYTNGYHWNPFHFILYNRIGGCSLGNYNSVLMLPGGEYSLTSHNSYYELHDTKNNLSYRIEINQDEGIDIVDRIELVLAGKDNVLNYLMSIAEPIDQPVEKSEEEEPTLM